MVFSIAGLLLLSCTSRVEPQKKFQNIKCSAPITIQQFTEELASVRRHYFAELEHVSVAVETLEQGDYFFEIKPKLITLFGRKKSRKYLLSVNPKVLNCPLPPDSLRAILIHEMQHIADYENWSTWAIAKHALYYLTSLQYRVRFERETDTKALERGAGLALVGHRLWVYQWLNPKELKLKKKIYLTPAEIEAWVNGHAD